MVGGGVNGERKLIMVSDKYKAQPRTTGVNVLQAVTLDWTGLLQLASVLQKKHISKMSTL